MSTDNRVTNRRREFPRVVHSEETKHVWCRRVADRRDPLRSARRENRRLRKAVAALYLAAWWSPDRPVAANALWSELRDAAGLPEGFATESLGLPRWSLDVGRPVMMAQTDGPSDAMPGTSP